MYTSDYQTHATINMHQAELMNDAQAWRMESAGKKRGWNSLLTWTGRRLIEAGTWLERHCAGGEYVRVSTVEM